MAPRETLAASKQKTRRTGKFTKKGAAISKGIAVEPTRTPTESLAADDHATDEGFSAEDRRASEVLVRHLFAPGGHAIDGIEYAVAFKLAEGRTGGDIVDVYHFDNGSVAFSIADVSGKGAQAAVHAALIKFGLRCFASAGLTPERTLRTLDRVILENNAFERTEQFASVFFGLLDDGRRSLTYASAGHEPVVLLSPGKQPYVLPPTAPLVGVFDDQHHLFRQQHLNMVAGSVLIGTTDGITEARSRKGEFFGMERLLQTMLRNVALPVPEQLSSLIETVRGFAHILHDDVAAFAVRVL